MQTVVAEKIDSGIFQELENENSKVDQPDGDVKTTAGGL